MKKEEIGYFVKAGYDLGNNRVLEISANIEDGADQGHINHKVDLVIAALERQRARAEVPLIEANIAAGEAHLRGLEDELASLGKKEGGRSSKDKMQEHNLLTNIGKVKADLDKGRKELAEKQRLAK